MKPLKRPLTAILTASLLVLVLAACGDFSLMNPGRAGGHHSAQVPDGGNIISFDNSSLSGAWHMSDAILHATSANGLTAETAYMPDENYIVSDGLGNITDSSFYNTATGTYSVDPDGTFTLTIGDNTFAGTLDTETSGTITIPDERALTAITNTAACQNTGWSLNLSQSGFPATYTLSIDVDATGAVTQHPGGGSSFTPTGGHLFCQDDTAIGAITTGGAGSYGKFRLVGIYNGAIPQVTGSYDNDGQHDGMAVGGFIIYKAP